MAATVAVAQPAILGDVDVGRDQGHGGMAVEMFHLGGEPARAAEVVLVEDGARVGLGNVIHCLDAYQGRVAMEEVKIGDRLLTTIGGHLRRTALLPVVSDFLFAEAPRVVGELAELNSMHDVFLVMIDSAFAFELPDVSAGWISAFDVETGESRTVSRRELRAMARRVRGWQDDLEKQAHEAGIDVLRLDVDAEKTLPALLEFVTVRRLRK